MKIEYFSHVIVGLVIFICFSLFRKIVPAKKIHDRKEYSANEIKELTKKYNKENNIISVLSIAFTISISYFIYKILNYLSSKSFNNENTIVFIPNHMFWVIPAVGFGFVLILSIFFYIAQNRLADRYDEYIFLLNVNAGFDCIKVYRVMSILILFIVTIITLFGLNWYTVFGNDKIIVNNYWGFNESSYKYSQIKDVYKSTYINNSKRGKIYSPNIILDFDNGQRWTSNTFGNEYNSRLEEYLTNNKKYKIKVVDLINEIDKK